jgi:hypothetical protein
MSKLLLKLFEGYPIISEKDFLTGYIHKKAKRKRQTTWKEARENRGKNIIKQIKFWILV